MISHLGRYEIISELGEGAMGVVYKARDPLIERYVAVKSINLQSLTREKREQFEARFYQEAKAVGHLNHPNIVTIHDLGESGDFAYIAMELMEGRELQHLLEGGGRLSVDVALDIAQQVACGLAYAHQRGIVHRDIKPSNIMVLGNNHVKIVDFGIAKMATPLALTRAGLILGSPLYMSPEQIEGKGVDARTDIFSLGVVLYQMLTWRRPFDGDEAAALMYQIVQHDPAPPSAYNSQIDDKLDAIVMKCLAKKPEARYASAKDLADDLTRVRDDMVRTKLGLTEAYPAGGQFKRLRSMATPGAIPQHHVMIVAFIAMLLIFAADWVSDARNATVQMHLLYLFPLAMLGFHCERLLIVRIGLAFSIALQIGMLLIETLPHYARITLATLFIPSDMFIVFLARIARSNFLDVAKLASFDGLTGLRNRLSFESILENEIVKMSLTQGKLSFAFVDLDNLKELNQARGYQAGDIAIKLIAATLTENLRQYDTVARIGGDEFAILMPETSAEDCAAFCESLSQLIDQRMVEAELPVTNSIGHATFDSAPSSTSEVFLKAEHAMHQVQAGHMRQAAV